MPRIHPTAEIEGGVVIGDGTAIWADVHVRGPATIGRDCIVGEKTYIAYGVDIADRVKINAMVYVCTAVTIETGVMIAAGTIFTNDRFPRAQNPEWEIVPTLVRHGASISANATIRCGVTIGAWAVVGAGSVVTHDVADHQIVAGNPARPFGWACRCGRVASRDVAAPVGEPRCELHAADG